MAGHRKQQGFLHLNLLLVLALVLVVVGATGYIVATRNTRHQSVISSGLRSTGSPPPSSTYVVTGSFTSGPTQPVCRSNQPCSAPVANHTVNVYVQCDASKGEMCTNRAFTTTTTDSQGQFSFKVPTGTYLISLYPAIGPGNQTWQFTETGKPLNLQLTAATGIE